MNDSLIEDDIKEMIRALEHDKRYSPSVMYVGDSFLRALGYDTADYPELEGHPGVRVIEWREPK